MLRCCRTEVMALLNGGANLSSDLLSDLLNNFECYLVFLKRFQAHRDHVSYLPKCNDVINSGLNLGQSLY